MPTCLSCHHQNAALIHVCPLPLSWQFIEGCFNYFLLCAAGSSLAGLSPEGSIDLPDRAEDGGTTATSRGAPAEGGDPALMGGHTGPTAQGAEFAQGAQGRAKEGREAQQRQLAAQTGDTLYPASGDATVKVTTTIPQQGSTYGMEPGTFPKSCLYKELTPAEMKSVLIGPKVS